VIEQLSKVPGLGDVPLLGKLFRSRSISKSQDELLVMVTPRIVRLESPPKQAGLPQFPQQFMGPVPTPKKALPGAK